VLDKSALTQRVDFHITANGLRRWEPYAPSAPTGRGIVGTQQGGLRWDQLLEARRAIAQAVGEPPEIIDGIVKTLSRRKRPEALVRMAACMALERSCAPESAVDMERSSPKSRCYAFRDRRFWLG
jgi:hypothetical protein